jgi:galactose mutarotase-like enzyme
MSLHHLRNNSLSITVNSLGAELCSVKKPDGTECMWQAQKDIWPRHAPVLFPVVGKLNNDKYTFEGQSYSLSQHGFARDMEFIPVEESSSVLEFELVPNEISFSKYPFHFSLRIRYELEENTVKVMYIVLNPNNSNLFFSIGAHPGFNCKTKAGETLNDYHIEFSNKKPLVAQRLRDGLVSDETYTVETTNGVLALSPELFANDALVFKNTQIEELTLLSKRTGNKLSLMCKNWPYFGIWSKKGCNDFVCLEPWYGIADKPGFKGELNQKEGIINLQEHQTFKSEFSITFS